MPTGDEAEADGRAPVPAHRLKSHRIWADRVSQDRIFSALRQNRGRNMRPRTNPFEKRKKELARKDRQKKKAERRDIRDRERADRPVGGADEDPDIAGIVPGPQPPTDVD
jgi:hypothetical protein